MVSFLSKRAKRGLRLLSRIFPMTVSYGSAFGFYKGSALSVNRFKLIQNNEHKTSLMTGQQT